MKNNFNFLPKSLCVHLFLFKMFTSHDFKTQGADCPAFSIDYNGQRCFSLDRNTQVFEAIFGLLYFMPRQIWHLMPCNIQHLMLFLLVSKCLTVLQPRVEGTIWLRGTERTILRRFASGATLTSAETKPGKWPLSLSNVSFLFSLFSHSEWFLSRCLTQALIQISSRAFERVPGKRLEGFDNKIIEQVQIKKRKKKIIEQVQIKEKER